MKTLLALTVLFACSVRAQAQDANLKTSPDFEQRLDARFRLFPTGNIATFILLDTATGRVWQMFYAIGDSKVPGMIAINSTSLLEEGQPEQPGRFTLYKTQNFFTFILLDQNYGRAWQCQWSLDSKMRWILPMPLYTEAPKADPEPAKQPKVHK